jgi:hypothetical protein
MQDGTQTCGIDLCNSDWVALTPEPVRPATLLHLGGEARVRLFRRYSRERSNMPRKISWGWIPIQFGSVYYRSILQGKSRACKGLLHQSIATKDPVGKRRMIKHAEEARRLCTIPPSADEGSTTKSGEHDVPTRDKSPVLIMGPHFLLLFSSRVLSCTLRGKSTLSISGIEQNGCRPAKKLGVKRKEL